MKFKFYFPVLMLSIFLLSGYLSAAPADSVNTVTKENLCKNWVLKEYKENGKTQPLYEYEIEFFANGKYVETEEGDTDKGTWKLNENSTSILFDVNTLDEDEFIIVSYEPEKLVVKFSDENMNYQFTLVPAK